MSMRIQKVRTVESDSLSKWMERLVKLIPGEIVPVYALVREYGDDVWQRFVWPVAFLILTFIFRAFTTRETGKSPQWVAAGIASVSFIFWVYITGGNFFGWAVESQVMTGIMLIYMLLISKYYKGD